MFGMKQAGLLEQVPTILKAMGFKIDVADVGEGDRKAAVLGFVAATGKPGGQLVKVTGEKKGGGSITALLILHE